MKYFISVSNANNNDASGKITEASSGQHYFPLHVEGNKKAHMFPVQVVQTSNTLVTRLHPLLMAISVCRVSYSKIHSIGSSVHWSQRHLSSSADLNKHSHTLYRHRAQLDLLQTRSIASRSNNCVLCPAGMS